MTEYRQHYLHVLDMLDNYQGDKNHEAYSKLFDDVYEYFHQNIPSAIEPESNTTELSKFLMDYNFDLKNVIDDICPHFFFICLIKRMVVYHGFYFFRDNSNFYNFDNFFKHYRGTIRKALSLH